jgi:DNA polymerase-3 subunit delta'
MPFPISWLEEKIAASARSGRLAHAFLLTGGTVTEQETAFFRLAAVLLGDADPQHPDLHVVRAESKSRRIRIEQIRDMEKELHLKAYRQGRKVAGILAADRMCLPPAQAANAFLKTLEEPPEHCVIFLTTDRPEQLLPTIQSRCITLHLEAAHRAPTPLLPQDWLEAWFEPPQEAAQGAYLRARLLDDLFRIFRSRVEAAHPKTKFVDDDEEEAWKALVESEFILMRDQSLAELIQATWHHGRTQNELSQAGLACLTLDELRYALSRNIDPSLANERCCLKISGLVH